MKNLLDSDNIGLLKNFSNRSHLVECPYMAYLLQKVYLSPQLCSNILLQCSLSNFFERSVGRCGVSYGEGFIFRFTCYIDNLASNLALLEVINRHHHLTRGSCTKLTVRKGVTIGKRL